jgi:hypothetical protein
MTLLCRKGRIVPVAPVSRRSLWYLLTLALFVWGAKYHPFLEAPRVIDDDARQHVYWTYRFQDPTLFPDDVLTTFISAPQVAPPGYQALYAIGARLMDALLFSQLLSLGLLLWCVWLMWRIGLQGGGTQSSAFAAGLLLFYVLYSSSGGLPKSFGFPLLLLGIYLAQRQAFTGLAGLFVLQSVLYPPILLNTGALAAATWWRAWRQGTQPTIWRQWLILGLGVGLAASVLVTVYTALPAPSFGHMVTRQQAAAMPEFSRQGRTAFYGDTPLQTFLNDRAGIGAERLYGFLLILVLIAAIRWPAPVVVPPVVQDLVWTSAVLFGLAHLVLFKLHLPARYVIYTLPVAILILIATHGRGTRSALYNRWPVLGRGPAWLARHRVWSWLGLGVLAIAFVYAQNRYIAAVDPLTIQVSRPALRLYHYLHTLPKDVLIAGHPLEMDNIPLFAQRKVLVNQELSLPYFLDYYIPVRQRLLDTLLAYYAAEPQAVQRFAQHYGVDYIVLNMQHFTPAFLSGTIYYEPFDSLVKAQLSEAPHFALLAAEVGEQVYAEAPYIVVSLRPTKRGKDGGTAARR